MGLCLASSINLGATLEFQLDLNDYFDLETETESTVLNASHDFRCVGTNTIRPVNDARAMVNNTNTTYHGYITVNYTNVLGQFWNQEDKELYRFGTGTTWAYVYFVTDQWNYYKINGETETTNKCEFNTLENSSTPIFEGGSFPTSYQIYSYTIGDPYQSDWIYIAPYDMGIMDNQYIGGVIRYHGYEDKLYMFNGTESKRVGYDIEKTGDLDLLDNFLIDISSSCMYDGSYVTDTTQENVADPPTAFIGWCFNTSDFFLPKPDSIMGMSIINHTNVRGGIISGIEIDLKIIYYPRDYFTISNVRHSPTNPIEGTDVTINWETSQTSNSKLFWRSKLAGEYDTEYTGWTSKSDSSYVYNHEIVINGSSVLEGRYYQYYIESNRTIGLDSCDNGDGTFNCTCVPLASSKDIINGTEGANNYTNTWYPEQSADFTDENNGVLDIRYNFTNLNVTQNITRLNVSIAWAYNDNSETVWTYLYDFGNATWERFYLLNLTDTGLGNYERVSEVRTSNVNRFVSENNTLLVKFNDTDSSPSVSKTMAMDWIGINLTFIEEEPCLENVTSVLVNDTNSGLYYNFSVFGTEIPTYTDPTYENLTAPIISTSIENLAEALGVEKSSVLNMFGTLIIFIITTMVFLITKRIEFGVAVFVTGLAIFSLMQWLPFYMFAVLVVVFSIGLAIILRRVIT